jgi:hypothetical protein
VRLRNYVAEEEGRKETKLRRSNKRNRVPGKLMRGPRPPRPPFASWESPIHSPPDDPIAGWRYESPLAWDAGSLHGRGNHRWRLHSGHEYLVALSSAASRGMDSPPLAMNPKYAIVGWPAVDWPWRQEGDEGFPIMYRLPDPEVGKVWLNAETVRCYRA